MAQQILLGLGCNLGNRAASLRRAVDLLQTRSPSVEGLRCSAVYETPALLREGAPSEWNLPFYNIVVTGQIRCPAMELLAHAKMLEQELGRQQRGVWAPREMDIDILDVAGQEMHNPQLTLPHAAMHLRAFVLMPLCDVFADWCYPGTGRFAGATAKALLALLPEEERMSCRKIGLLQELSHA